MRREARQLLPLGVLAVACLAVALLSAPSAGPSALLGAQAAVRSAGTRQGARARGSQAEQLGALVRLAATGLADADHAAAAAGIPIEAEGS
ncbi:hypothetical protein T484DRAFT_1847270 [Baffinella frigidus]|nr:hypothetical protein T484DRAFT_1847270 [Cryptophyta sp. CCMP2293]